MSTTSSTTPLNPPPPSNPFKPPLTLQTKSPSFSNMKTKRPKFQTSKPSYLLSGIASKLLLDLDTKSTHLTTHTSTFSPTQNPPLTIRKKNPSKPTLPNNKHPPITTDPSSHIKTISVNTNKSTNDKRLKERPKISSKHKEHLSLSITHPNSTSLNKDNKHSKTKYNISKRKLQTSNSFTGSNKLHSKLSERLNTKSTSNINSNRLLTSESSINSYRQISSKKKNNTKSGSNIFSNRSANTNQCDIGNGILQSKLLSSPKIQIPPKKIANSPTQIYHPKFGNHNVNIYTPSKMISTKPIPMKNLGKTKSMNTIMNNTNENKSLSKGKNGFIKSGSKHKGKTHFSKPGSPSVRSGNSSGRNSFGRTTVYIEADKVKQKFKKKVQNEITKRKYSNHKIAIKEDVQCNDKIVKEITFPQQENEIPSNNEEPQIELRVLKIDSCTMAGFSEPNVQKINQDNFFIEKCFFNKPEQFFVGVCDGHGMYGHFCSDYIANNFPSYLNDKYTQHYLKSQKHSISLHCLISQSFISFNNELISQNDIDSSLSGSTCVALVIFQDKLICANLGDSRAVLSRFENGSYSTMVLSRDHKPTEQDECERIKKSGGKVCPYFEEETQQYIGPNRIWFKDSGIPGLAMTRSFGDEVAHKVGVISEPEIKEVIYNGNEKFMIIASDGVWEFIDCEESVHIVKEYYEKDRDAKGAVRALVGEAFRRWRREEDIVDDITALVVFFE